MATDDEQVEPPREPEIFSDPRHRRADARMFASAVEKGWLKDRFPTRATKGEIERQSAGREAGRTVIELAIIATTELLVSADERCKATGARVAVAMERLNQVDQLHALKSGSDPSVPQPTTRTPDQIVLLMDGTIPLPENKAS